MTEPSEPTPTDAAPTGAREPEQSPQRRLLETISAYEVDPPAPSRAREDAPPDA